MLYRYLLSVVARRGGAGRCAVYRRTYRGTVPVALSRLIIIIAAFFSFFLPVEEADSGAGAHHPDIMYYHLGGYDFTNIRIIFVPDSKYTCLFLTATC